MWTWLKAVLGGSGGCAQPRGTAPPTLSPYPERTHINKQDSNSDHPGSFVAGRNASACHVDLFPISSAQQCDITTTGRDQSGGQKTPVSRSKPVEHVDTCFTTPTDAVKSADTDNSRGSSARYLFSDGKPVGIANTVRKYQESNPVLPHVTPFERRVERKIQEEQAAAAVLSDGGMSKSTTGPEAC
eukprot:jgi/Chrzof1/7920/Cz02g41100.t1